MTTSTLTLSEFLLARIEEDETVAWAILESPHWVVRSRGEVFAGNEMLLRRVAMIDVPNGVEGSVAIHIARHDPARVLAECKAKRAIVERCSAVGSLMPSEHLAQGILGHLASIYADHPDFNPDWS